MDPGEGASDDVRHFVSCFKLYGEKTSQGLKARTSAWQSADPNGNGIISLSEYDGWIQKALVAKYKKEKNHGRGEALWRLFRPCYIHAFHRAKGLVPGSNDDYVTKREFRLLNAYLCVYVAMLDAFAVIDGGGAGVDANDDRRITNEEWMAGYKKVANHGFVALAKVSNPEYTFSELDADGGGIVLLGEWCKYLAKSEVEAKTSKGALLGKANGLAPKAKGATADDSEFRAEDAKPATETDHEPPAVDAEAQIVEETRMTEEARGGAEAEAEAQRIEGEKTARVAKEKAAAEAEAETQRLEEERTSAEALKLEEERAAAEAEAQRLEKEEQAAAEALRLEEEALAETQRLEEARIAEETRKLEEEEQAAVEALRLEEEALAETQRLEEARIAEEALLEEERVAEAQRLEEEHLAEAAEAQRHGEEARTAEESIRLEANRTAEDKEASDVIRLEEEQVAQDYKSQEAEGTSASEVKKSDAEKEFEETMKVLAEAKELVAQKEAEAEADNAQHVETCDNVKIELENGIDNNDETTFRPDLTASVSEDNAEGGGDRYADGCDRYAALESDTGDEDDKAHTLLGFEGKGDGETDSEAITMEVEKGGDAGGTGKTETPVKSSPQMAMGSPMTPTS